MRGERDLWITADEMQAIANAIPTQPRLVTMPKRGHERPFVYGDPEVWTASVRQFLDQATGT